MKFKITEQTAAWKLELKIGIVILLSLSTVVIMSGFMDRFGGPSGSNRSAAETAGQVQEGIIRFHVIANSDTEEDQELKLQVRNHVISKIQTNLADLYTREMALEGQLGMEITEARRLEITRKYLKDNLEQIEEWAEETVTEEGFAYSVKAELGPTWIPERNYDGIYFPAGTYEALNLVIGNGQGQNWWCVIFPPLCLIDCSEEMKKQLGEERMAALLESGGGRIVLKSRIAELLRK